MSSPQYDRLRKVAEERASRHPARVGQAVRRGGEMLRRKVLLMYAVVTSGALVIAILATGVTALAGDSDDPPAGPTLQRISVQPAQVILRPGELRDLWVIGVYSDGSRARVEDGLDWRSADPAVVRIDDSGTATAVGAGRATVTAEAGDLSDTAAVSVTRPGATLTSIDVRPGDVVLPAGETQAFGVVGIYSDGSRARFERDVVWSSDATEVVEIDDAGKATAIRAGEATVTATSGELSDTATVTVPDSGTGVVLERIEVEPGEVLLLVGQVKELTVVGIFSDGTRGAVERTIEWRSENEKVVQIDAAGNANGVAPGLTNVTAFAGGLSDTALVSVRDATPTLEKIVVDPPTSDACDGTQQLVAEGTDENGKVRQLTAKEVTWSSDNVALATVDDTGLVTWHGGAGSADITAAAENAQETSGVATVSCTPVP